MPVLDSAQHILSLLIDAARDNPESITLMEVHGPNGSAWDCVMVQQKDKDEVLMLPIALVPRFQIGEVFAPPDGVRARHGRLTDDGVELSRV